MTYKKPQSPIMNGTDGIYPLTTADQIIKADGSRLEQGGKIMADDSAKLGGEPATAYTLKSDVDIKINKSDALTLEEIEASTDLLGKVASASALKSLGSDIIKTETIVRTTDDSGDAFLALKLNNIAVLCVVLRGYGDGTYDSLASITGVYLARDGVSQLVKVVDDSMAPLANTKVAIKVYYVDAKYIAS